MVMSISTMSGLTRLNSAMAVRPSPASPATSPAELLDHLDEVLAREDGIVHHEVADRLIIFFAVERQMVSWTSPYPGARLHERWEETGIFSAFLVLVVFSTFSRRFVLRRFAPRRTGSPKCREPSSGIILFAYPLRIAARGIPLTPRRFLHSARWSFRPQLDRTETFAPSSPMPVIKTPTAVSPNSCATEWNQDIGRWPMPIHRRPIGKYRQCLRAACGEPSMWRFPRTDEHAACQQKIARGAFLNFESAAFIEALRKISVNPSGICCTITIVD